jgi:homoserine kinase
LSVAAFRICLPATSANLGAAFDSAAVALDFYLTVEAEPAESFSIAATGRDADVCGRVEGNLILDTYTALLQREGRAVPRLALRVDNQIPLGMGCGSSAAGRLAAVALAAHFGGLDWDDDAILAEACALEGHPDNAAACWLGGMVVAADDAGQGERVLVARVDPPANWRALIALPDVSLATSEARAVLPPSYTRADVVANLQAASLLGLAFAQGRGDLLQAAMRDRIHQPYRAAMCSLLPRLLPLAGAGGILGVALSGAGPSVLLIVKAEKMAAAVDLARAAMEGEGQVEILQAGFASRGAAGGSEG